MPLLFPLLLSSVLFGIGLYGVLSRRNAVLALMGVELMLNAVMLDLVAFDVWLRDWLWTVPAPPAVDAGAEEAKEVTAARRAAQEPPA